MDANSQRSKGGDGTLSSLNVAIEILNLAKEAVGIAPAKAAFGSVSVLLTMVRVRFLLFCGIMGLGFTCVQDSMINERDYVELGLGCVDICRALDRGMSGKRLDDLSQSVCEAINQLTTWVKPMVHSLNGSLVTTPLLQNRGGDSKESHQTERTERGLSTCACEERQGDDRHLEAGPQQDPSCLQCEFSHVFAWSSLIVPFQTELAINSHTMLADVHRTVLAGPENTEHQHRPVIVTLRFLSMAGC